MIGRGRTDGLTVLFMLREPIHVHYLLTYAMSDMRWEAQQKIKSFVNKRFTFLWLVS